nr:hypothetical protein [uncultured bacterium]
MAAPVAAMELEELQDVTEHAPLRVEDATAQKPGAQAQLSAASRDDEGELGLVLRPQVSVGLPIEAELGLGVDTTLLSQSNSFGPVEGYALKELVSEGSWSPALGVKATVMPPHEDVGFASQLGLLATWSFGAATRAHVNAAYQPQNNAGDRFLVGVSADRVIASSLMLVGDVYYERMFDEAMSSIVSDIGAAVPLGEAVKLQGVAGVQRTPDGIAPRFLFGITASP